MKTAISLVLVALLCCSSCQKKSEASSYSNPSISGKISNPGKHKLKLFDFLGKSQWQQDIEVMDSAFTVNLNINTPVFKTLAYGNTRKDIFLKPNKSLIVYIQEGTFKYDGDLAHENSILDAVSSRLQTVDFPFVSSQPLEVAKKYIDSLEEDSYKLLQELTSTNPTSSDFQDYTKAYIKYDLAFLKLMLGERKDEQPDNYYDFLNTTTLSKPELLDISKYRSFLVYYLERETNLRVQQLDAKQQKSPEVEFNESLKVIEELENEAIRAYCFYNAMIMKLKESGINDFEEHYQYFITTNTDPYYKAQMEMAYAEKKKIAPGQPAPEFTLKDVDGNMVSLGDFKGKYVYLDFWQTLCPRSARELPHYLKLQSEYNTENIAFVSISVNEDENVWRDYVKAKKNVGTSLRATEYFDSEVYKEYQVNGLPSFVLIDTEGKIIDSVADKPSSEEIRETLNELLHAN
ncbi:TlpA family protein disulfide reductase [Winogradskyella aurantia]|uniref:Thioredoxin domain-containing protein n=1 Tax=Winogradskyella aurantia TaxID=1915063 RepID=A0A265URY7_9FLAO|nr:TlpA disulfide reductase family protein [Winogradskyella aurantia]OZV67992.1 hypothetical protein CA834_10085 [Winogradskyella aurantia]